MLKTRRQKPFCVSTKSATSDACTVRKDLEKSLKRLNLDYIDFYHFWCIITLEEYEKRKKNGVLKEFEKLKDQGLIKHICISTHLPGTDIEKVLADYPFEGVLLGYSVMNFKYRDAGLDAAAKSNRGVVVMNPLGGGLIPQNPGRFGFVKTQKDETVVQGALRFLINDKRTNVALVGLSSQAQLDEALSAVDGFKPISRRAVEKIRSGLDESFDQLCTSCQYCDKCPQGISVPRMMDAYNHKMLSDKRIDMINRLRWHWEIDLESNYLGRCTQCGLCEEACTQRLPIRQRLQELQQDVEEFVAEEKGKNSNSSQ
jgi:predicted aldo/keto reductase-like oxidoreductase